MASPSNIVNVSNRTINNTSSIKFRNLIAKDAVKNLLTENQVFFFAAKEGLTAGPGTTGDTLSQDEITYENITLLERVTPSDVSLVTPRVNYESGVVYDAFDPTSNKYEYDVDFNGTISYKYKP